MHYTIIDLVMLTQFLHAQLVLFGQFSNNKIKCKHKYEHKNGQIIVHQLINRTSFITNNLVTQFMQMLNQQQRSQLQNDHQSNYPHHHYHPAQQHHDQHYEDIQQEDEQYDRRGYEGYFDQDSNPYADEEVYGLTMDAQYIPQQFNGLYSSNNIIQNHAVGVPFQTTKQYKESKQQQDEDQQGWITQQQEQYYVNEQLEQAAGNFATDFISDNIQ